MRTCPHLCSGKRKPQAALVEPVNTVSLPSDRILAMRISLVHFLSVDLGSFAATHFKVRVN